MDKAVPSHKKVQKYLEQKELQANDGNDVEQFHSKDLRSTQGCAKAKDLHKDLTLDVCLMKGRNTREGPARNGESGFFYEKNDTK